MNPEEQDRAYRLFERLVIEQDPQTFEELVRELNEFLAAKRERIRREGE